jgi:hypothetical protein
MTIEVQDGDKLRTYTLKPFGEVTIADWRKLGQLGDLEGLEARDKLVEVVKALTGIPMTKLRRVPAKQMEQLLDMAGDIMAAVALQRENTEVPASFTLHGVTYTVPQDVEGGTTFGQYEDLNNVLMPKCEVEADIFQAVCAALCLPEGTEYDGSTVMARMEAFNDLPIQTAMLVSAFFFDRSETFRSAVDRCTKTFLTLRLQALEPTPEP